VETWEVTDVIYIFSGLAALIVQLIICFSCKQLLIKLAPVFLSLSLLIYAGLRFLGVISFQQDVQGVFEGGLVSGIVWGALAVSILVGLILAWCIYCVSK